MKRLFFVMLMCIVTITLSAQTKVHTVQRGETVASVAKKYGISVDELKKANPNVNNFFYIGMALTIPTTKPATLITSQVKANTVSETVKDNYNTNSRSLFESMNVKKFEPEIIAGLSVNGVAGDGIKGSSFSFGFHAGIAGRYYFWKGLFAETSLTFATKGYKVKNSSTSGRYYIDDGPNYDSELEEKMSTYNIEIPINVGYKLSLSNNLALKIKAGPYLTYAVAGKQKRSGYYSYNPDIHSRETEYIDESTNIGDIDGYKPFGVGIGIGIGVEYQRFSFTGTYQRGLTKLMNDSNIYEQNILVTLGYLF